MSRLPLLALVVFAALQSACARILPGGPPPPAPWRGISADAQLYTDNAGGIRDSVRLVIRDANTLRDQWQRATAGQTAPPTLLPVDFAREMVLMVAAGRKTLQDQIRVDSVRTVREIDASGRREEVMSVMVHLTEGCGRFTTPGYPIQIVRVPRFEGRVSFTERRERASC
jgi:hypothetical protein